jgi:hypothetical protein
VYYQHLLLCAWAHRAILSLSERPRIVFVIQAHSGWTPLASLAQTLTSDLQRVWENIMKPATLQSHAVADYFQFSFVALPHLRFTEDYKRAVASFRTWFSDPASKDYVFQKGHAKTIPASDLGGYMKMIWVCQTDCCTAVLSLCYASPGYGSFRSRYEHP